MKWVIINDEYLKYLRENVDSHIPYNDYGSDKYKPFFGELFRLNEISYITQISSFKEINKKPLEKNALFLYTNKYNKPNSKLAKRCLDFKKLEEYCLKYETLQKQCEEELEI